VDVNSFYQENKKIHTILHDEMEKEDNADEEDKRINLFFTLYDNEKDNDHPNTKKRIMNNK